jgi:transcription-repair coupling factor (superfamily II helicase)
MNEAIDELKENEFKDLYPEESNIETKEYVKDLQIDTDFELLFSDEYINNVSERLSLYNELGTVKTKRIGSVPKQVDRPFWSNAASCQSINE